MIADTLLQAIARPAREEPDSGIVVAATHGFDRPDVIPLWSGEGNRPTPEPFCRAAVASLLKGETFYTWQRGIPELREALARYHISHYGRAFGAEDFFVTGGGMQAIQTAIRMIAGAGDEIVLPTPAWPNYAGPIRMQASVPVEVEMAFENGAWHLDLDRLRDAIGPRAKAICINSPSNPLGWTATIEELTAIRDMAREHGLWIIADEVYARFWYGQGPRAPSFLDICAEDERLLLVNTFSKNWAMTGWRVGWLQAPRALSAAIARIIQYNTSGTAAFLQRGCVAALEDGEPFVEDQIAMARANRDMVAERLRRQDRVHFAVPDGAFYLFLRIDGMTDSTATTLRIIDEAGVGFAPGATFGPGGEGHLRMCFLRDPAHLIEAMERFDRWLVRYGRA